MGKNLFFWENIAECRAFLSLEDKCCAAAINLCQTPYIYVGGLVKIQTQYKSVFECKNNFVEATRGLGGGAGKKLSSHDNFYM